MEKISRAKYIPNDNIEEIDEISGDIVNEMNNLISKGGILDA